MTLNDFERPKRTLVQKRCVFGAQCTKLNDPYIQQQKCMLMTLVSGNIRYMRILAGVPLRGGLR